MDTGFFQAYGGYIVWKATDKLTVSARGEYASGTGLGYLAQVGFDTGGDVFNPLNKVMDLTGTVEYDLWANVISRIEVRWDHACNGAPAFGGTNPGIGGDISSFYDTPSKKNEVMVAANIIYKF